MAFARISLQPPPNIDVTKATLAYGRLAIIRVNRELNSNDLLIRQRAVKALCDYLHNPEHIAEALSTNVIVSLIELLHDKNISCQAYAAECFFVLSQHDIGRYAILNSNVLHSFYSLVSNEQPDMVRLNTQKTIQMITVNPLGAKALVDAKFVPLLIICAEQDVEEIKIIVLETLDNCLAIDTIEGLNTNGMSLFTSFLNHQNPKIKALAAKNIARLSPRGKQEALNYETVPALVNLLNYINPDDVKAAAAGSLAFICTTNHGKYAAINLDAIELLLKLIQETESSHVCVNAFKAITCLAEAPEGRRILLDDVEKLMPFQTNSNSSIAKHATIAVNVIKWKP